MISFGKLSSKHAILAYPSQTIITFSISLEITGIPSIFDLFLFTENYLQKCSSRNIFTSAIMVPRNRVFLDHFIKIIIHFEYFIFSTQVAFSNAKALRYINNQGKSQRSGLWPFGSYI